MNDKTETGIENLEVGFVDSVTSEHLSEIAIEGYESIFDLILEEGFIKNLPVFGMIYKSGKALLSIRDQYFVKKVFNFLYELKDTPVDKRRQFIQELDENEDTAQRAGETLVMLIDRLDNLEKPQIIARLLKAKVEGHIDLVRFLRLSSIIERAFMPDLKKLYKYKLTYYDGREDETITSLSALGLVQIPSQLETTTVFQYERPNQSQRRLITKLGDDLLEYGIIPS